LAEAAILSAGAAQPAPLQPARTTQRDLPALLCALLLAATVLFNPALAWVNAHVMPLSPAIVSAVQGAIVIGALLVGTLQPTALSFRWLALTWLLVGAVCLTSAIRAQLEPKILGDILLIPAFILLGTRIDRRMLCRTMIGLQAAIMLVGIWELLSPSGYGGFFSVLDYYVKTRGYDEAAFWAGGDLFLSSERPGGRMLLDGFGFHRGSSLFLEPVSLGNWAIVGTIFTAALWHDLSRRARLFMAASTLILLIVCDGRLALSVIALFCLYLPLARFIPDRLSVLYIPLLLCALTLGAWLGFFTHAADNFAGRLSVGLQGLQSMDIDQLLGVAGQRVRMDDAGWADFVQAQSLIVSIALWMLLGLTSFGTQPDNRMAKHGILLFITLCLPISNSLLSVKTAAAMWALYGFCFARGRQPTLGTGQ